MDEITHNDSLVVEDTYKPSEILGMFQNYLARQSASSKVIFLKGVYIKSLKNNDQWTFCYDVIRDENTQEEITIKITPKQREDLKDGNLIRVGGIIGRQVKQNGFIQLVFNVSRIEVVKDQIISESEIKMIELRKIKSQKGFKNVDTLLEGQLFIGNRPSIALVFATTSITMSDFDAGKDAAASQIDFIEHRISFGNAMGLSDYLKNLDSKKYDVIALIRGGGSGIECLDDLLVLEAVTNLQTPFICAIGHVDEKLFIKNIADKVAPTPNGLGNYFSNIVETVSQKKNKSRAILVEQVKKQFEEQIKTAEKQNKDLQEKLVSLTKSTEVNQKAYAEQIKVTEIQNKELKDRLTTLTKNTEANQKVYVEQIKVTEIQNKELRDRLMVLTKTTEEGQKSRIDQIKVTEKQNKELQDKLFLISKNAETNQKQHEQQMVSMQSELKKMREANEEQAKYFSENVSKSQQMNEELQKALNRLNAQNTQSEKDLATAKMYAAQLEQQLNQSKKGGCFGVLAIIICFVFFLVSCF